MATSVMDQGQQESALEQAIEQLDEQIGRQRADLFEWEDKQKSGNALLADLKVQHVQTCADQVLGKASPSAATKIAGQITDLENKLLGIGRIVSVKRDELAEAQAALQPLHVALTERAQARMIVEERNTVETIVADTEQALADLNSAAERFATGLNSLRQRQYRDEKNRSFAFDNAQSLQRRGAGMRA